MSPGPGFPGPTRLKFVCLVFPVADGISRDHEILIMMIGETPFANALLCPLEKRRDGERSFIHRLSR